MKKCITLTLGQTTITKDPDYDPDTSYLGEYGDIQKPGCIVRQNDKFIEDLTDDDEIPEKGREYRFFYPPENGEKIGTENYKKYALQDYQNMENLNNNQWGYCCIIVETAVNTDMGLSDIARSSLCGIEDHWDKNSDTYIKTVIKDLKSEQKTDLLKMGFKEEEINESFNNAEEVNL